MVRRVVGKRITVDVDNKNLLLFIKIILIGFLKYGKFPKIVKFTRRGFHLGWFGIKIPYDEVFIHRWFLGDDRKRIMLDYFFPTKPQQTFFDNKVCLSDLVKGGKVKLLKGLKNSLK